jgi:FxsC-like protein
VRQVAESLVADVARRLPAISGTDASAVPPRFGRRPATSERPAAATEVPDAQSVTLLCLAASRGRMTGLRRSLDGYGERPEEWRPFLHQTDETATGIVSNALRAYGVGEVAVRPVTAAEATDAGGARSAVLLVDPWLARAFSPEELRRELAGWVGVIGAVVVVMARGDEETKEQTIELRRAVLARVTHVGLQAPHHEAGSAQGLAHAVIGAVADMLTLGPGAPGAPAEPLAPAHPRAEGPAELTATPETRAERLSRRRRERATWLSPVAGLLPPLLLGTSGGTQAET